MTSGYTLASRGIKDDTYAASCYVDAPAIGGSRAMATGPQIAPAGRSYVTVEAEQSRSCRHCLSLTRSAKLRGLSDCDECKKVVEFRIQQIPKMRRKYE